MSDTTEDQKILPAWLKRSFAWGLSVMLVPILYLFGLSYEQGYLHAYGVSSEFFSRDLQAYLVMAYYGLLSLTQFLFKRVYDYSVLIVLIVFVGTTLGMAVVSMKRKFPTEKVAAWVLAYPFARRLVEALHIPTIAAVAAWSVPSTIFLWSIMVLLIPLAFYGRGEEEAIREMAKANPCAVSSNAPSECIFLFEGDRQVGAGILVARSSTHLALFNDGRTRLYPIKDQWIEVVPPKK